MLNAAGCIAEFFSVKKYVCARCFSYLETVSYNKDCAFY